MANFFITLFAWIFWGGILLGLIYFIGWMIWYAYMLATGRICYINFWTFVILPKKKKKRKPYNPQTDYIYTGGYSPRKNGKPRKVKPEWWRFLTEESIGSLLEKRKQKKKDADARANDPWRM